MAIQNAVAVQEQPKTGIERIKGYMFSPEVKERFSEMMGPNGIYYLNQVMIVVAGSPKLQECNPSSILVSAMRAASLKLSVDPSRGEAWIIPYKGKATFQLGYRGVYELAMRTNQYRIINPVYIYEGETIEQDRMTGLHSISGERKSNTVTHIMLYFRLFTGFEKTFVMSIKEIEDHAEMYSPSYHYEDSPWNAHNGRERMKMMEKTVLSNGLRKWGRFNSGDMEMVEAIEADQGWKDNIPNEDEVTVEPDEIKEAPTDELLGMLGVEPDTNHVQAPVSAKMTPETAKNVTDSKHKKFGDMSKAELAAHATEYAKRAKDNGMTQEQREQNQMKWDAAKLLMATPTA